MIAITGNTQSGVEVERESKFTIFVLSIHHRQRVEKIKVVSFI